ncbi:hypothetical protein Btru_039857 [Bulinus truncatus]|nr:hypothetical protein Btru_039857 [Bulinus truncatus]
MDLGLDFDDEDLEVAQKTNKNSTLQSYTVKMYTSEWFESALAELKENNLQFTDKLATDQIPHAYKMSGDIHYFKGNYKKASEQYISSLEILPENNVCVRQDIMESLCRSYIYLGQVEESYTLAKNLVEEMSTQDEARQRQSLILFSFICSVSCKWAESVECLEKLCSLQPYYAQFWNQLGDAYAKLSDSELPLADCSEELSQGFQIKKLTCYIRTKLIHQSVLGTASGVIRNRNLCLIRELEQKIDSIPMSETEKSLAMERMQDEIENQSSQTTDSTDNTLIQCMNGTPHKTTELQFFYQKFYSWHPKFHTVKNTVTKELQIK